MPTVTYMAQIKSLEALFLNLLQIRVGDAQVNTVGAVVCSGTHVLEVVRVNGGQTVQEVG